MTLTFLKNAANSIPLAKLLHGSYLQITILMLVLLVTTTHLYANSTLRIYSPDGAIIDLNTKTTTYLGNVVIENDEIHITGDAVTTQMNQNNEFAEIIAIGKPATYTVQNNNTLNPTEAEADLIKFYPKLSRMYLIGNAVLDSNERILKSAFIDYDLEAQNVYSRADNFRQGRIILRRDEL